jgi:hypothetical protein
MTTTVITTSGSSSSAASTTQTGVSSTCIVGQQGCLCDTMGMCAPGLMCTPQTAPSPSLCCMGTNCTSTAMSIGASCGTTTGAVSCTPGVTTLTAAAGGTTDGCGYPTANFNESTTLCGIVASGGGATPAIIEAFYTDEHALPLGCAGNGATVTPFPGPAPAAAYYPSTGDPTCVDSQGRPIRPVLYITDITSNATCKAGDQQMMGTPYDPIAVFGTWKTGGAGTNAGADPSTLNYWNLGSSADTVPQSVITACPCTMAGDPGCNVSRMGKGYSAELKFEAGLISGHSYRLQVMLHDGDQSQGGDSGEGCATFCAGTGSSCGELPPCASGCPTGSTCNASSGCCQ